MVAAASFHKDDVLNISLEKELNLNVYQLEDFYVCVYELPVTEILLQL